MAKQGPNSSDFGNRLLIYNAFPRVYRSFGGAIEDFSRISSLGFNAVWLNPLNAASEQTVKRVNFETATSPGEKQDVTGSLYATKHYDHLNYSLFPDLQDPETIPHAGNPKDFSKKEAKMMRQYTDTARDLGLSPIFDLVLNHVAIDSPLINGDCEFSKKLLYELKFKKYFKRKLPILMISMLSEIESIKAPRVSNITAELKGVLIWLT